MADWGRPADPLQRVAFLGLQVLDGFPNTADHAAGRLPSLIAAASFEDVVSWRRLRTMSASRAAVGSVGRAFAGAAAVCCMGSEGRVWFFDRWSAARGRQLCGRTAQPHSRAASGQLTTVRVVNCPLNGWALPRPPECAETHVKCARSEADRAAFHARPPQSATNAGTTAPAAERSAPTRPHRAPYANPNPSGGAHTASPVNPATNIHTVSATVNAPNPRLAARGSRRNPHAASAAANGSNRRGSGSGTTSRAHAARAERPRRPTASTNAPRRTPRRPRRGRARWTRHTDEPLAVGLQEQIRGAPTNVHCRHRCPAQQLAEQHAEDEGDAGRGRRRRRGSRSPGPGWSHAAVGVSPP